MIAAIGLVILPKFDANGRFFSPRDLVIWWMTSQNFRAHVLYYINFCASFQIHGWIQTGVTVRKRSIRVEFGNFLSRLTLKFDGWPWKIIGHLFYTTSSFVHYWVNSNWSYSPKTLNSGQNRQFFVPCDIQIWRMTLKNNRTPLLCCFYLCVSFHSHQWIQTRVTVRKRPIWIKIDDFFCPVWPWNLADDLETNRAPLPCYFKLYASFRSHCWIQTGVTVRTKIEPHAAIITQPEENK